MYRSDPASSRIAPLFATAGLAVLLAVASPAGAAPVLQAAAPAAPAPAASPALDLSTPEKTLAAFGDAMARSDYDAAVRCVEGATAGELVEQMKRDGKMLIVSIKVSKVQVRPVAGDEGRVTATFTPLIATINGTDGVPGPPETLTLRRTPEGWKIVAPARLQYRSGLNGLFTDFSHILAYPEEELKRRARERESSAAHGTPERMDAALSAFSGDLPPGTKARIVGLGRLGRQGRPQLPSPAAAHLATLETYLRAENLKELLADRDTPFVKGKDGFTDADARRALAAAKAESERLVSTGAVRLLPPGTRVTVVEHVVPTITSMFSGTDNQLEKAQKQGTVAKGGAWKVELLPGATAAAGEVLWTVCVQDMTPSLGDAVTLRLPAKPTTAVPVAADFTAKDALLPGGRVGDTQAQARFDRLVREKRFVLLPAGTPCLITDAMVDGSGLLVKPQTGPHKGRTLWVRPEHVALVENK